MIQRHLVAAALAAALAVAAGSVHARNTAIYEPGRVVLTAPDGKAGNQQRVRGAIIRGSSQLGWVVTEDKPGVITLKYNKGNKHEAVIQAKYDAEAYTLSYVSSYNLDYEVSSAGQVEIHPNYNKWIHNLIQRIQAAYSVGQ